MNKKISIFLLSLLTFTLVQPLIISAQDNPVYIREISLTGLKRTKEEVVYQIIDPVRVGSVYTDELDEIIIQKLRETGIFVPDIQISTELIESDAYININIKDRWTLIPIPIVSVSKGESWNAGLLTIENNLFGYYKTLGLGFFYGSEGWTFLSFFSDRYFLKSDFEVTAAVSAGLDDITDLDVDESVAREYQTDKLGLSFGLQYPLTDRFSLGGSLEYDLSFPRGEDNPVVSELNSLGLKSLFIWKDVFYDIPYEKGFTAQISASANWNISNGTFYPIAETSFQWSFTPWFRHLVSFKGMAGWGMMPIQQQFRLGGLDGSRILPMGKVASDEYALSTAIYNLPLWIFKGGTISSKVFYEFGYFKSDLINRTLFHGPGVGLEFYINNLAIPAVGLNLGWNLETGLMQFSAGIGM